MKSIAGWIEQDGEWIAKPCNSCELVLPLDKFYYVKTREIHSNFCKPCHDKKGKERTQKIPDKLKKYYHDRYIRLRDENKK